MRSFIVFFTALLLVPALPARLQSLSPAGATSINRPDSAGIGKPGDITASFALDAAEKQRRAYVQELHQFKIKAIAVGIAIVAVMGAGLLYARFRHYKTKQEVLVKEATIRQQHLAAKAVMAAEENERKRIAGDLHDGVGQMLSAVKMNLSGLSDKLHFSNSSEHELFIKTLTLVDESCREVRYVSHHMMPNALLHAGLTAAVKEFIDKIDDSTLKVHLHTEGLHERLDATVETVLYRVVQEAVNNVIKHAGASRLDVSLIKDREGISVTVEDNGKGFDTTLIGTTGGMGIGNIIKRLEYLQGVVDVDASPGKGTLLAIHVPVSGL